MRGVNSIKTASTSKTSQVFESIQLDDNRRSTLSFTLTTRERSAANKPTVSLDFFYFRKDGAKTYANKNDVKKGEIAHLNLNEEQFQKFYTKIQQQIKVWEATNKTVMYGINEHLITDKITLHQFVDFINNKSNVDSLSKTKKQFDMSIIENVINKIEKGINEQQKEEYWQNLFNENDWILSQLFTTPIIKVLQQCYLGGKSIDNSNGKVIDYIYSNKLTKNVSLIEIKTPCAQLMQKNPYRGTNVYGISTELSGAINQLMVYRDTMYKDWLSTKYNSDDKLNGVDLFNPKTVLIAGLIKNELNNSQINNFDLFRKSLNNFEIITFDELLDRIKALKQIFESKE